MPSDADAVNIIDGGRRIGVVVFGRHL